MKRFKLLLFILLFILLFQGIYSQEISDQNMYIIGSLNIEEYLTKREDLNNKTLPYLKNREKWRKPSPGIEEINKRLDPMAYKFIQKSPEAYDFSKGNSLVMGGIINIRGFSMDRAGRRFVFFGSKLGEKFPESEFVCINGEIQRCTREKSNGWGQLGPCYVNNNLISCEVVDRGQGRWRGTIRSPFRIFYKFNFTYGAGGMPIHLRTSGNNWVLQIDDGRLILDGTNMCKKYKYSGMWEYRLLKGKPFFFFTKKRDKKFYLSYDGREIHGLWYDFIGDDGKWAVSGNDVMIWFYARRDNRLYYVEVGIYE